VNEHELYFDYLSPYAYLAACELPEFCARHGLALRPRPVLFAGLLHHWGQRGPAEIAPKGLHAFRECMRYAHLRGIAFHGPRHHPFNPLPALRVSLPEVAGDAQLAVVQSLYALAWGRGGDPGDRGELTAALAAAGVDGERLLAASETPGIKDLLRSETERAVRLGVFGVPTMLVRGELFWGLDQLRYVELFLQGKDPLASFDWQSRMPGPAAAWRKSVPPREPA
jgi:2-hydroxychromene-2-carboxylate isomerase